jgi:plastocyanin
MIRSLVCWAILVPVAVLVLGPVGTAAARTIHVRIAEMQFAPQATEAAVGDVIEWANEDFVDHTATSKDGAFDVVVPAGKEAQTRIGRAGAIAYFCRFHPQMTGSIAAR